MVPNISLFLTTTKKPPPPQPQPQMTTLTGGLKLPPFPPRLMTHNAIIAPTSYMDQEEADSMKGDIFVLLDQFEDNPPFTIQRLCELCVDPMRQYKSVGKYLRAVEKTLLVTSTWNSFPPLSESEIHSAGRSAIVLGSTLQSAPSTPLFSPIPFLHDDARRSKSRSPPPSAPTPLSLDAVMPVDDEVKALGLVDELDDPSPGHMSDHPTALSSVTTVTEAQSKSFIPSLEQRFVKSEEQVQVDGNNAQSDDSMDMDEDKENTKA
ncbi:hypothetical protein D9613_003208 [Agrocybe pediades]|uniref:PPP4R2-domain-containing protein n=1 Tax=Agrocybe pediades TaxID=84607 RepID=A0A8H4VLB4_9AGAR|nr:hypothetical protein D9613_003208 [Agrocybe pediades]